VGQSLIALLAFPATCLAVAAYFYFRLRSLKEPLQPLQERRKTLYAFYIYTLLVLCSGYFVRVAVEKLLSRF
jgi:heme/copper-type cytochrome/quinol oxidase subunit 3